MPAMRMVVLMDMPTRTLYSRLDSVQMRSAGPGCRSQSLSMFRSFALRGHFRA